MKPDIHPEYETTTIRCACGNEVTTRATVKDLRVDICSNCHPFYTGKQRLVDTAGMVERFRRRYNIDGGTSEGEEASTEQPEEPQESASEGASTEEAPAAEA